MSFSRYHSFLPIILMSLMMPGAANSFFASTAVPPAKAEVEGQALAAELRAQRPAKDYATTGVLIVRDGSGRRWEVPVRFQTLVSDPVWRSVYEAFSPDGTTSERLTVVHTDQQPNQYLLYRNSTGHSTNAPSVLTGDQTMVPFAGTDFWVADLGLEFLDWPEQRLVKKEMRKGRSCRVLESINPQPAPGGYARVLSWIDFETNGLLMAEAYGPDGKLLKEFNVRSFKKVNGRWELKRMEIENNQTASRTSLEFDFTVASE
ncbi:MAG: outer membrane lipoprotein-sorting protein [Candidatus Omnitrophica bacterium]|nr:outer membrane lipoprotein-sorting protein [Candidatus Omnitrophota bacterium]